MSDNSNVIAMDCEMVGVGHMGRESMLARISLVNKSGQCVYDEYIKPYRQVMNYRTPVSGIKKHHLVNGQDFQKVQMDVADILRGRILVGHSLEYDFAALGLYHPAEKTRDTALYKPFLEMNRGKTPSLKFLANRVLGKYIQQGPHSSVEDARVNMELYCAIESDWEASLRG